MSNDEVKLCRCHDEPMNLAKTAGGTWYCVKTTTSPETDHDPTPHSSRHPNWKGDDAGYHSKHQWMQRHHPKTGTCEECGTESYTEWSNIDHQYRRVRADWRELCSRCHKSEDARLGLGRTAA